MSSQLRAVIATTAFVYRRGLIAAGVSGKYARQQIGSWAADAWASYYAEKEQAFADTEEEVIPGLF